MTIHNPHWLAYAFGFIGILVEWRSYALSSDLEFRRWSAAAALLWAVQYFFVGAWTAGLTMGSTALRTVVSTQINKRRHKHFTAAGFVVLFCLLTAISWQGSVSLFPAFAVINTTLALFYLDNRTMRLMLLLSSVAWLLNDWYWQAWTALIAESVAMVINGYTIRQLSKGQGIDGSEV